MEKKKTYFAFVHKGENSVWAEFADLDGCFVECDTLEQLASEASKVLTEYINTLVEVMKQDLPKASTIEELKEKAKLCDDEVDFILPVNCILPSKAVRVQITCAENKLDEINAFCHRAGRTRSDVMVSATLNYIAQHA